MAKAQGGSGEEIRAELRKLEEDILKLERARALGELKKPHERRIMKRHRARLITKLRAIAQANLLHTI